MASSIQPTQRTVDSMRTPAMRHDTIRFTARAGELAQRDLEGEDHAEPDGVPVVVLHDGQEQRHEDQEDGDAVEEHAHGDEQHDEQRQHTVFAQAQFTMALATGSITPRVDSE